MLETFLVFLLIFFLIKFEEVEIFLHAQYQQANHSQQRRERKGLVRHSRRHNTSEFSRKFCLFLDSKTSKTWKLFDYVIWRNTWWKLLRSVTRNLLECSRWRMLPWLDWWHWFARWITNLGQGFNLAIVNRFLSYQSSVFITSAFLTGFRSSSLGVISNSTSNWKGNSQIRNWEECSLDLLQGCCTESMTILKPVKDKNQGNSYNSILLLLPIAKLILLPMNEYLQLAHQVY